MKVTGPNGLNAAPTRRAAPAASGFVLPEAGAGRAAATSSVGDARAVSGLSGLSGLMALQGVETVTERRRRAIRRGHGLLDRLEALKLDLLSGGDGVAALTALGRAAREARPERDAPDLEAVLDQIDLRAAVEMAKAERR